MSRVDQVKLSFILFLTKILGGNGILNNIWFKAFFKGRKNKEDTLDYSAGIVVNKNINDYSSSKQNVNNKMMVPYKDK